MRIAALILALALFVELASPNPVLQSPKGAELFHLPRIVQLPPARMTITISNEVHAVSLVWNPSPGTNVASYRMYYGVGPNGYTNVLTVKTNKQGVVHTNCIVSGLAMGVPYYFTVTAVASDGLESDYSNVLTNTIPVSFNTITLSWTPTNVATVLTSPNLKTWTAVTNTASPWTKLRTKPVEFYRLLQ